MDKMGHYHDHYHHRVRTREKHVKRVDMIRKPENQDAIKRQDLDAVKRHDLDAIKRHDLDAVKRQDSVKCHDSVKYYRMSGGIDVPNEKTEKVICNNNSKCYNVCRECAFVVRTTEDIRLNHDGIKNIYFGTGLSSNNNTAGVIIDENGMIFTFFTKGMYNIDFRGDIMVIDGESVIEFHLEPEHAEIKEFCEFDLMADGINFVTTTVMVRANDQLSIRFPRCQDVMIKSGAIARIYKVA